MYQRDLGLGQLLSATKDVFLRSFRQLAIATIIFLGISFVAVLIAMIPTVLFGAVKIYGGTANGETIVKSILWFFVALAVVSVVISFIYSVYVGMLAYITYDSMVERERPLGEIFKEACSGWWKTAATTILQMLLIWLGFVFFLIPGIYLMILWIFVPFVVLFEGKYGMDALRASAKLVKGRWWRTVAYLLAGYVVILIVSMALQLLMSFQALAIGVGLVAFLFSYTIAAAYVVFLTIWYHARKLQDGEAYGFMQQDNY